MRVSQRTEYGIRAMIALAQEFGQGLLSIKELAEREEIPESFLEQIMADLRRAGLIKSTRGAYGGYRLTSSPSKVTVGSVISTLEGSLSPARCLDSCERLSGCSTRTVMQKIEESITDVLDHIYLKDLLEEG